LESSALRRSSRPERGFSPERLELIAGLEDWHFWFIARQLLIERLLARHAVSGGRRLLDIGCGTGRLARRLAGLGFHVLGMDRRRKGLPAGGPAAWFLGADARRIPLRPGACGVITALDVLEHTGDLAAMAEMARVLEPGGIAVVTVPALPWLWSARDEAAGHRRRYTRRSLNRLVTAGGLELIEMRYYQCLLFPLLLATRLTGRRSARALSVEERPGPRINRLLLAINRLEVRLGDFLPLPWGSTLTAVCRRPARP
jgi:SAM-dependent methyltransferase